MSKTYQETLDLMNDFANGSVQLNKMSDSDLSNIIVALDKQIPKKINSMCVNAKMIAGYCPTCGGTVLIEYTFLKRSIGHHCDWCGQKIDIEIES